jgi:predicted  nucleic acid-binding Zn-ribbon protein
MKRRSDYALASDEQPKRQHRKNPDPISAAPIPLIDILEDGTMALNPESEALLRKSNVPLMVICVVGRSRTGKSFLMNRVLMGLKGAQGFQVSPSTRACTKGLWIPGAPIPSQTFWNTIGIRSDDDGIDEPYNVLVVDTEGINALDRDQSYDMRIFTLALLLSSVFVFNSLGAIDENAISTLSAVASVAETLTKQANRRGARGGMREAGSGGVREAAGSGGLLDLPSLLWAVRDFSLDIECEASGAGGIPLSDDQYLESALECAPAGTTKAMLRSTLMKAFPQRLCQTMVRPAEKEEDMKRLQDLEDDVLRPEFVKAMQSFRSKLKRLARVKHVGNETVDGHTFCDLLKLYLEAVNSNRVPVVTDAWTQVTQQRTERAVKDAVTPIEEIMLLDPLPHPVALHHQVTLALLNVKEVEAQVVGFAKSDFDRQVQQRILIALKTLIIRAKAEFDSDTTRELALNMDLSLPTSYLGFAAGALQELHALVRDSVRSESTNQASVKELELARQEYKQLEKELEALRAMWTEANRSVIEKETRVSSMQEEIVELKSQLAGAKSETLETTTATADVEAAVEAAVAELAKDYKVKIADYEDQLDELDEKLAEVERERQGLRQDKERLETELETQKRSAEMSREDVARLRDQLSGKNLEITKLVEDHGRARLEWATRLRESETMAAKAQGTSEALAARLHGMDGLADTLNNVRTKLREQELEFAKCLTLKNAAEDQLHKLKLEMQEKEAQLFEGLRTLREMQRVLRR